MQTYVRTFGPLQSGMETEIGSERTLRIIYLPRLQELSIMCRGWGILNQIIPKLRDPFIYNLSGLYIPTHVSPVRIHCSVLTDEDSVQSLASVRSDLRKLIESSSDVEMLTIRGFARPYSAEVIRAARELSLPLESLKTIVVEPTGGQRDVIHVPNIS